MTKLTLMGLPTCDTCRSAKRALEADGHHVALRDVRAEPLTAQERAALLDAFGAALINRRSATWRSLPENLRAADPDALLAAHPAVMKRPVISDGTRRTLGWDAAIRAAWR